MTVVVLAHIDEREQRRERDASKKLIQNSDAVVRRADEASRRAAQMTEMYRRRLVGIRRQAEPKK